MMIWNKKPNLERLSQFMINFILFIKQCYCILKCRKNAENKNPKNVKTKKCRIMILSKCAVCVMVKSWNLSKTKRLVDY